MNGRGKLPNVMRRRGPIVAACLAVLSVVLCWVGAGVAQAATGGISLEPGASAKQGRSISTCSWQTGVPVNTQRFNPGFGGDPMLVLHTLHTASYCGANDASWPRIGDVFYVSMYAGVVNPLVGDAPSMGLVFDGQFNDAYYSISNQTPVRCLFNGAVDTANCSQSPGPSLTGLGASFGGRALAPGQSFEVLVPIYVTHPKSGIGSGNAALFGQSARMALSPDALATQWLFVANRPNELTNDTVTGLAESTARTQTDAYNYWRAGQLTFELGSSAGTYNLGTQTVALDGSQIGAQAWAEWTNLAPGTTFHWRARLTTSGAPEVVGPNRTFTTAGTSTGGPPTTGNPVGGSSTPVATPQPPNPAGATPTPTPTPTPSPTAAPATSAPAGSSPQTEPSADRSAPAVAVSQPACGARATAACAKWRATRAAWRALSGTVTDAGGVAKVEVAVRLKAGTRCSWWKAGRWVKAPCGAAPIFSAAKLGAGTWQLTLGRAIPSAGKLRVQAVATDQAGNRSPVSIRSATVR